MKHLLLFALVMTASCARPKNSSAPTASKKNDKSGLAVSECTSARQTEASLKNKFSITLDRELVETVLGELDAAGPSSLKDFWTVISPKSRHKLNLEITLQLMEVQLIDSESALKSTALLFGHLKRFYLTDTEYHIVDSHQQTFVYRVQGSGKSYAVHLGTNCKEIGTDLSSVKLPDDMIKMDSITFSLECRTKKSWFGLIASDKSILIHNGVNQWKVDPSKLSRKENNRRLTLRIEAGKMQLAAIIRKRQIAEIGEGKWPGMKSSLVLKVPQELVMGKGACQEKQYSAHLKSEILPDEEELSSSEDHEQNHQDL